jgi:hypothetical protein
MELFVQLQGSRQQLLSIAGNTNDLLKGLIRNAELQDQLNINRYLDINGVHKETVRLAYHFLMSSERHQEKIF